MTIHAINANTFGISEYKGLSPVKILSHGGRSYVLTSTQLLELTGSTDDGTDIDAYIQTGKIDFGSPKEKRVSRAYVRDQYANALELTTLIDAVDAEDDAVEDSYTYSIPGKVGARQNPQTERLRRDLKGTGWAFKIANVDGGGLVLKGFSVDVEGIEIDAR